MPGPERPLGTSTVSEIEDTVSTQTIPQLQQEGSPILLLAYLYKEMGHLPRAGFTIHGFAPDVLTINLHRSDLDGMSPLVAFEQWRVALGLDAAYSRGGSQASAWLSIEGRVHDVAVSLSAYGSAAEVDAAVAGLVAA